MASYALAADLFAICAYSTARIGELFSAFCAIPRYEYACVRFGENMRYEDSFTVATYALTLFMV